jgi:beta-phosphoglucomutase-like phosphatase (HAD superfamily)
MIMGLRAVIFDCDGVLVDTEPLGRQVLARILEEHLDLPTSASLAMAQAIWPTGEPLGLCLQKAAVAPLAHLEPAIRQAMARELALRSYAVPGMPSLVHWVHRTLFQKHGRPMVAVCSNGPKAKMNVSLWPQDYGSLDDSLVVSAGDLGHFKPAPDALLMLAKQMGVLPAQCVVVDDSQAGLAAAQAAGMTPWAFGPESQRLCDEGLAQAFAPDARALKRLLHEQLIVEQN